MTPPVHQALRRVLHGVRHVLLDFDGPFCSVFAGLPAAEVSAQLVERLGKAGHTTQPEWASETDPLALLRLISEGSPELVPDADAILADLEVEAVQRARPNPDIERVLDACAATGRRAVVVSNNSGRAIRSYLDQHGQSPRVREVLGRVPGDPSSMKPSPRLLFDAMGPHEASACVFIGDAVRDVDAGHAAGVPTIGFANKSRKERSLAEAGAVVVVTSMADVAEALERPLPAID